MGGFNPSKISVLQVLAKLDVKKSCYVTTTASITLSGSQVIDGISVPDGARVLVKNQSDPTLNGIYVCSSGGAWARSTDADDNSEVQSGLFVYIQAGDLQGTTQWYLATPDPISLGITGLQFSQFSSGGSAGTLIPGNGLQFTGDVLDIVPDADGSIVVGPHDIKVGVINNTQHGNRGNGSLHSVADASNNGFLSKDDFSKLTLLFPEYTDVYTPTNGQTDFVLSHIPQDSSKILLFINGQQQIPGVDFTMISSTILRWGNQFTLSTSDTVWLVYDSSL